MKSLLFFLFCLSATCSFSQTYSKVKIYTDQAGLQELAELGLAVDHGERKHGVFFVGDFSESDLVILEQSGVNYEVVVPDVKAYYAAKNTAIAKNETCESALGNSIETPENFEMNASYAGFYKYQDMLDALDSMAAMYPNLITVKTPISTILTHENRPVYFVKISDDPTTDDASEPNALYSAIHHAREPMSMSQLIFYMWYLLENYDSDPEIQYIIDNTELFFVPCLNPDGYIHNEANDPSGFGMHRKNKAPVGTNNPGVDLNRNYSYGWNTTGVSQNVNQDTYPGTGPFSEPETQAMKWLVENYGFKTAMNAHSYGELLLFPVGTTLAEFADHHDYFQDLSSHMTKDNGYSPIKSSGLYPASGDSDDYMYKDSIGVGNIAKDTIFAMTPETGTDFWPSQSEVVPTCAAMVFSNMTMAHITHRYLTAEETDNLMIDASTGYFHHEVQRLGFEAGAVDVYIEPVLNIQTVGAGKTYDLAWHQVDNDSIAYTLVSGIQFGDEVKYVLVTDYSDWQRRDTITKVYDQWVITVADPANSTTDWTGTWSLTTDDAYSPTTSFADSDGGDYNNNDDKTWTYANSINLSLANDAAITFYAKWEIEADYDYCQFQVSLDGGSTWIGQCGLYTVEGSGSPWSGSVQPNGEPVWEGSSDWVQEQISLSDYIGNVIDVRFQFGSDGGVSQDGFYFDDFTVSIDYTIGLEEDELIPLTIAPNPSSGSFILSAPFVLDGDVLIHDQTGKLALSQRVVGVQKQVSVSTEELPAGIYYVSIEGMSQRPAKLVIAN